MNRKDKYYKKAKKQNYRSRASFKLIEIQNKFNIINKNSYVIEFGSSPGGWTQVIKQFTDMPIISVDLNAMQPIDNVLFIQGDILNYNIGKPIRETMAKNDIESIDVFLSDAMVRTSGIAERDSYESYTICEQIMVLSEEFLKRGGNVLLKQFQGEMTNEFLNKWKDKFQFYKITKPHASRKESREIYIILKGKK